MRQNWSRISWKQTFPIFAEAVCSVAPKPPSRTVSMEKQTTKMYPCVNRNANSPEGWVFQGWSPVAPVDRVSLRVYLVRPERNQPFHKKLLLLGFKAFGHTRASHNQKMQSFSHIIDYQRHTKQTINNKIANTSIMHFLPRKMILWNITLTWNYLQNYTAAL